MISRVELKKRDEKIFIKILKKIYDKLRVEKIKLKSFKSENQKKHENKSRKILMWKIKWPIFYMYKKIAARK